MLAEDTGQGDLTTALLVPRDSNSEAQIVAKEFGVIAGIEEAKALLKSLRLRPEILVTDGEEVNAESILMKIFGDTRTILSVERTLLNIVARMSGIATTTRRLVERLHEAGLNTRVAATRKVAPGLLYFDKKAVLVGGGDTHRLHLDDMILIKDNHIAVSGSLKRAVERVKRRVSFSKKVEVEITEALDSSIAAEAGADIIMFDNFSTKQIENAVKLLKEKGFYGKVLLEASGGITSENILDYACTGVDIVSLGELTHSAKILDVSLEIIKCSSQTSSDD
ncbi:carboxylating nicotinate-nucleotide diphosphorylase [Candidatus Bathyarchaeota archaeon]|nr:carboxylating nicotinate-nucleotide diphosphorylase [Candidatus Bathyarchaeota archaeon]